MSAGAYRGEAFTGFKWKVVMLGDFSVGKTSLVRRFVYDEFSDAYLTTIGVKVTKKNIQVALNGKDSPASLLVWDISGNDRFNEISPEYVKGAAAGIIVGDVTRPETAASMARHCALLRGINPGAVCVFALNKMDLADAPALEAFRAAGIDPGEDWHRTSAKDGRNVQGLFESLAGRLAGRQA